MRDNIKELMIYIFILLIMIILIFINNTFFYIGKELEENELEENINNKLNCNNTIYNVPYNEMWLD